MVKVYNKGIKPIVFLRNYKGAFVIQPGKFETFPSDKAKEIIDRYPDAVDEKTFFGQTEEKKPVRKKAE